MRLAGVPGSPANVLIRSRPWQFADSPSRGPADRPAVIGVELHDHPHGELSKLSETPRGTQQLQALDDAPVELDQFVFGLDWPLDLVDNAVRVLRGPCDAKRQMLRPEIRFQRQGSSDLYPTQGRHAHA